MRFKNFFTSGYQFTVNEYELENKFILANALLLALSLNMFFFTWLMYLVKFDTYIVINLITASVSLTLIFLLRIIQKENLDSFGYFVFFAFMMILFFTYTIDPINFPGTSWFAILIIPSLVIHGHRFAFLLSLVYFAILWFFYEKIFGTSINLLLVEFPPLFLTLWFVYFYNQRYRDSLQVIEEKHAYLLQQSRMASMGEMIENIAHQWRQPLSQINSSVLLLDGVLKQKNVEDTRIEEKLLEIESLTLYMSNTIDDFKNFFEQNKKVLSFSVDEVFDNVFSIIGSRLLKHNIYVEYINDTKFTLKGYPNELQQVILVIVNNAIDSLVGRKIVEPKIVISVLSEKEFLKIQIEDNAKGIDVDMIDKVFYPYFTTKKESHGRGVGLYMSKMIIEESMHGMLHVENTENGACFIINIPQKLISYET